MTEILSFLILFLLSFFFSQKELYINIMKIKIIRELQEKFTIYPENIIKLKQEKSLSHFLFLFE